MTDPKIKKLLDDVIEARKHDCPRCGHPMSKHAFDIFPVNTPGKCELSCMVCLDELNKESETSQ